MRLNNWKIWLDTQLSLIIAKWMTDFTGFTVKSSYSLQSNTLTDLEIYDKAKAFGQVIIISKDADFPELISRLGAPPKLIVIKKGNCNNNEMWGFLKSSINQAIKILTESEINIVELD